MCIIDYGWRQYFFRELKCYGAMIHLINADGMCAHPTIIPIDWFYSVLFLDRLKNLQSRFDPENSLTKGIEVYPNKI